VNNVSRSFITWAFVGCLLFTVGSSSVDAHTHATNLPLTSNPLVMTVWQDWFPKEILIRIVKVAIATLVAFVAFWGTNKVFALIQRQADRWQDQRLDAVRFQRLVFLSNHQIDQIIDFTIRCFRIVTYLIIFYFYVQVLLSAFPATAPIAERLINAFWGAISSVWKGFLGYLPNLITILVFLFIAYGAVRFSRFIFKAIDRGTITIPGFYREWAQPTSSIATFLICAFAVVLIFPLLPAADSPSFQGISIFIGALLTLGSSTAISNIISGYISIYTRAFQEGDRIEVNGITGDVIDKTILSTQILTPDNEVVTIPNSSIISSNITNYAASYRNLKKPLILKTTVTLGYDIPWRKIYEVLIDAALSTEGVLSDPQPFVWQTSLNDYYPSYCLRAYTMEPNRMGAIYSQLHENIQDKCNEAGIEILSPFYAAVRDGNTTTIPENYLPESYHAPGFRVDPKS
jgi:small-conductance mechanosensitive channel